MISSNSQKVSVEPETLYKCLSSKSDYKELSKKKYISQIQSKNDETRKLLIEYCQKIIQDKKSLSLQRLQALRLIKDCTLQGFPSFDEDIGEIYLPFLIQYISRKKCDELFDYDSSQPNQQELKSVCHTFNCMVQECIMMWGFSYPVNEDGSDSIFRSYLHKCIKDGFRMNPVCNFFKSQQDEKIFQKNKIKYQKYFLPEKEKGQKQVEQQKDDKAQKSQKQDSDRQENQKKEENIKQDDIQLLMDQIKETFEILAQNFRQNKIQNQKQIDQFLDFIRITSSEVEQLLNDKIDLILPDQLEKIFDYQQNLLNMEEILSNQQTSIEQKKQQFLNELQSIKNEQTPNPSVKQEKSEVQGNQQKQQEEESEDIKQFQQLQDEEQKQKNLQEQEKQKKKQEEQEQEEERNRQIELQRQEQLKIQQQLQQQQEEEEKQKKIEKEKERQEKLKKQREEERQAQLKQQKQQQEQEEAEQKRLIQIQKQQQQEEEERKRQQEEEKQKKIDEQKEIERQKILQIQKENDENQQMKKSENQDDYNFQQQQQLQEFNQQEQYEDIQENLEKEQLNLEKKKTKIQKQQQQIDELIKYSQSQRQIQEYQNQQDELLVQELEVQQKLLKIQEQLQFQSMAEKEGSQIQYLDDQLKEQRTLQEQNILKSQHLRDSQKKLQKLQQLQENEKNPFQKNKNYFEQQEEFYDSEEHQKQIKQQQQLNFPGINQQDENIQKSMQSSIKSSQNENLIPQSKPIKLKNVGQSPSPNKYKAQQLIQKNQNNINQNETEFQQNQTQRSTVGPKLQHQTQIKVQQPQISQIQQNSNLQDSLGLSPNNGQNSKILTQNKDNIQLEQQLNILNKEKEFYKNKVSQFQDQIQNQLSLLEQQNYRIQELEAFKSHQSSQQNLQNSPQKSLTQNKQTINYQVLSMEKEGLQSQISQFEGKIDIKDKEMLALQNEIQEKNKLLEIYNKQNNNQKEQELQNQLLKNQEEIQILSKEKAMLSQSLQNYQKRLQEQTKLLEQQKVFEQEHIKLTDNLYSAKQLLLEKQQEIDDLKEKWIRVQQGENIIFVKEKQSQQQQQNQDFNNQNQYNIMQAERDNNAFSFAKGLQQNSNINNNPLSNKSYFIAQQNQQRLNNSQIYKTLQVNGYKYDQNQNQQRINLSNTYDVNNQFKLQNLNQLNQQTPISPINNGNQDNKAYNNQHYVSVEGSLNNSYAAPRKIGGVFQDSPKTQNQELKKTQRIFDPVYQSNIEQFTGNIDQILNIKTPKNNFQNEINKRFKTDNQNLNQVQSRYIANQSNNVSMNKSDNFQQIEYLQPSQQKLLNTKQAQYMNSHSNNQLNQSNIQSYPNYNKKKKQLKGQQVDYNYKYFDYLETCDNLQEFKISCLKQNSVLYQDNNLLVYQYSDLYYLEEQTYLKIELTFQNQTGQDLNEFELDFSVGLRESLQIWLKPQKLIDFVPKRDFIQQQIIIDILQVPYHILFADLKYTYQDKEKKCRIAIPNVISKYFTGQSVSLMDYQRSWSTLNHTIFKSQNIEVSKKIARTHHDLIGYFFPGYFEVKGKNQDYGGQVYRLGGQIYFSNCDSNLLIRINWQENNTIIFQILNKDNKLTQVQENIIQYIIQTYSMIFGQGLLQKIEKPEKD